MKNRRIFSNPRENFSAFSAKWFRELGPRVPWHVEQNLLLHFESVSLCSCGCCSKLRRDCSQLDNGICVVGHAAVEHLPSDTVQIDRRRNKFGRPKQKSKFAAAWSKSYALPVAFHRAMYSKTFFGLWKCTSVPCMSALWKCLHVYRKRNESGCWCSGRFVGENFHALSSFTAVCAGHRF